MYAASAQIKSDSHIIQATGNVLEQGDNGFLVGMEQGVYRARPALSCLIEPVAGDRVLIAGDLNDELFIIAVLERTGTSPLRIAAHGDITIGVSNGRFSIAAANGVDIVSAKGMNLTAAELSVKAQQGSVFFNQLTYIGSLVFSEIEKIKLIGGFFDTVMERISQKVKRSYRIVEEIDQVRSSEIDYRADKNVSLRGQNALLTAKELVKIDGDQIHLG